MSSALDERLRMGHLGEPEESTEEIKQRLEKRRAAEAEKGAPEKDPRLQRRYPFEFSYRNEVRTWTGTFVNVAPKISGLQKIEALLAELNEHQPIESMGNFMLSVNRAIAHLTYSLERRPDWAKDLRELDDPYLVLAIYQEVLDHEAIFRGLESPKRPSQKAPQAGSDTSGSAPEVVGDGPAP